MADRVQPPEGFFIGWQAEMPANDRRFFIGASAALIAAAALTGGALAALQAPAGSGSWDQDGLRDWAGWLDLSPFPILHSSWPDGTPQSFLLATEGKCGVADRLADVVAGATGAAGAVTIRASPIRRGAHAMLAVVEAADWVEPLPQAAAASLPAKRRPNEARPLGQVALKGEILDSKCWFGAMRPARGKSHKACAALCIRGGIPPAFFTADRQGRERLMLLTDRQGRAHGSDLLPLVADPVRLTGSVVARGPLLYLQVDLKQILRL